MDAAYTGNRIAALRKEKGLTQKELSDLLHVTDKAVSKWERGLNFPELSLLEPLSAALDTTVADLLGLEEPSGEQLLEAATQLHSKEKKTLARKVALCCRIMVIVGATLLLGQLLPARQEEWLTVILAVVLIAVGRTLWTLYGNLWGDHAPPFVVSAPSSMYARREVSFSFPKPEEPPSPDTLARRAALIAQSPRLLPALRFLLLVGLAELPLGMLIQAFTSRLALICPILTLIGAAFLYRILSGRRLRAAVITGALQAALIVTGWFLTGGATLAAAAAAYLCSAAHLFFLLRGLSGHVEEQGFPKLEEDGALAAGLNIAVHVAAVLLLLLCLFLALWDQRHRGLPPFGAIAAGVAAALQQGSPTATALNAICAIFRSTGGYILSNEEMGAAILGCLLAALTVLYLFTRTRFLFRCCRALQGRESISQKKPSP